MLFMALLTTYKLLRVYPTSNTLEIWSIQRDQGHKAAVPHVAIKIKSDV